LPQVDAKIRELVSASQSYPPPPFKWFLTNLAALDTAYPDAIEDFVCDFTCLYKEDYPKPIPIGTHDGVQYFINVSDEVPPLDASSAGVPPPDVGDIFYGADFHPVVNAYEAKSISTGKIVEMDLRYGIGIGRLYHKTSEAASMEDTEFYVICNAVDKSLWVSFDFEPRTETGDIYEYSPETGEPYGKLPQDTQHMMIGIMRLFGPEWTRRRPLSLEGGDPFRHGTPLACRLVAKRALVPDVVETIKAGRRQASQQRSSRE
jgi:hypothetical protein